MEENEERDEKLRAVLEARHRAAEATIRRRALEASDKRRSALDAALAPLLDIAAAVPTPERDAFAAYVLRRINRVW
ncbi:MAG: hypothetical protein J2P17_12925 [Mycobacterium sp.]|nr:hypothetical protein [Mycobacterium sp.]